MKKTMTKTVIGVAMAILIVLAISQVSTFANQEGSKGLEGTWNVQVTLRNCLTGDAIRTFPSLVTYSGGGTVMETTSAISPTLRYPGQGVWHYKGAQLYGASFMFFRFNPDGSFAGTQKITQDIELTHNDELDITASVEVRDAANNLTGTGCVTSTGTRFE